VESVRKLRILGTSKEYCRLHIGYWDGNYVSHLDWPDCMALDAPQCQNCEIEVAFGGRGDIDRFSL
jgi:hypothetical protein